jgi:DNA-binding NarL/FixJ family response regulator
MKKAPKEELAAAIREIVQGGIYVSREVAYAHSRSHSSSGPKIVYRTQPALWKTYRTARCIFSSCLARGLAQDKSLIP